MGMNSVIVALNDHLHHIRDDPDFGRKIYDAILGWPHLNDRPNSFQVVSIGRADFEQIVGVSHNGGGPLPLTEQEAVSKERRRAARAAKRERTIVLTKQGGERS